MALKIDEVIAELRDIGVDSQKLQEAEKALRKLEEEKKDDRAATHVPKTKNQYVIVLNNSSGVLPPSQQLTGWVLQLKEGLDPLTTLDRVTRAAKKQNTTMKKFIKKPLKTLGDALQNLKRKFTKEEDVHIKTQEEVAVILTDNNL